LSSKALLSSAIKYRLLKSEASSLTSKQRQQRLQQVDIMPLSLALAQRAEESGWTTYRFTKEGNAFFGQWIFLMRA
jgi:Bax protein